VFTRRSLFDILWRFLLHLFGGRKMPLTGQYKRPLSTMPDREFRQWIEANWPANFYNWQHATDRTKVDGAYVYAGSIAVDALAFVPVEGGAIIATINASEEGITIDAAKLTLTGVLQVGGAAADTGWGYDGGVTYIDGANLKTGTVLADTVVASISITTPTITGGTIQTDAAATAGIKIDTNGIHGYDDADNELFNVNADTGIVTAAAFQTGATGPRVYISSGTFGMEDVDENVVFFVNPILTTFIIFKDLLVGDGTHEHDLLVSGYIAAQLTIDAVGAINTDASYKIDDVDVINANKQFVGAGGVYLNSEDVATNSGNIYTSSGYVSSGQYVNAVGGYKDNGTPGTDGTFTSADSKTITVSGGIITGIV